MSYLDLINGISEKIQEEMKGLRSEEYHPSRSTDDMDDYIKTQKQRIDNLVHVRKCLEFIGAGYSGNHNDVKL